MTIYWLAEIACDKSSEKSKPHTGETCAHINHSTEIWHEHKYDFVGVYTYAML